MYPKYHSIEAHLHEYHPLHIMVNQFTKQRVIQARIYLKYPFQVVIK